jgi:hypothetical protein
MNQSIKWPRISIVPTSALIFIFTPLYDCYLTTD